MPRAFESRHGPFREDGSPRLRSQAIEADEGAADRRDGENRGGAGVGRADDPLAPLLRRTADGDRDAFEALYKQAAPRLFALCTRMLRRQVVAEEVLQEAFVQIWRDARHYKPERAGSLTWMGRIVRNRAIDVLRSARAEDDTASADFELEAAPDLSPGPLERSVAWAQSDAVRRCLNTLTSAQREALLFAFFRGYSHLQLARALDTPLGTIKGRIRLGMQRLRDCLER